MKHLRVTTTYNLRDEDYEKYIKRLESQPLLKEAALQLKLTGRGEFADPIGIGKTIYELLEKP